MWPTEAIERLSTAREEVKAGRAVSVEAALAALRAGVESSPQRSSQRTPDPPAPMEGLLEELKMLRGAVEGMSRRLGHLDRENRELGERLRESVKASPGVAPETRELEEPEDSGDKTTVEDLAPDQADQVE